jgi:asparagine synthase (glutamine-hydrolysing)
LEIATPSVADVDLTRSLSRDLPRPNARAFVQAADLQSLRHAQAIGADAFFSGGGGDDVFCYLRIVLPAIDRLRADGWRAMLSTSVDVARMNHATIWDALLKITRRLLRGSGRKTTDDTFLGEAARDSGTRGYAREIEGGAVPGKVAHVDAVLSIHNYLEGHARAEHAPIYSPLLSQPVVECCLAIPSWLWCRNGRNRAGARDALADRLPKLLLERRSKGSFDGFCAQLLDSRRKLIGDMLVDGILARQGLIDPEGVRSALLDPFPAGETVGRMLALVDAESWASGWDARLRQRS